MKSSMSTWMRAEATLNPAVLLEGLTPHPNLILRVPVAVSLQLTSTRLDAMSFVLLQPRDPLCLLTEAAQHLRGRRTEPETIFHLGHPLRTQARHCHWGKAHPPLCHSRPSPQLQNGLPSLLRFSPESHVLVSVP